MKFSAQEEYGLRCLIQVAKNNSENGITIAEISEREGLTTHNVAKLLRILRKAEILNSIRGHTGGYILADRPENINISKVLATLGGRLYDSNFCEKHTGIDSICTHTVECTMRSLWTSLQNVIDRVLVNLSLKDLMHQDENTLASQLHQITESIFNRHDQKKSS
jgi:Rrf2 family protein